MQNKKTDLGKIYNRSSASKVIWWEDADIYEYIVGKFLILLNFDKLGEGNTGKDFIKNKFSVSEDYNHKFDEFAKKKIIEFHTKNDDILDIYNCVSAIEEEYLSNCDNCKAENDDVCGHMIMQYFLYDPITIQPSQILPNLYGGNRKKKYL